MLPASLRLGVFASMLAAAAGCAAETKTYIFPKLKFARVNLASGFQVDPAWPKRRPAGVPWGQVPGIAVDRQDRVWMFTRTKPPVQVYAPDGTYLFGWGSEHVAVAHDIAFDGDGNVWLADAGNHTVRKFTPEGKLLLTLGTPGEPGEDERHFNRPTDMVVTPDGDVYVTDGYANARVVRYDRDGKFVKTWGKAGTGPGEFSCPHAIARDSKGRLYVADRNNVRVQVFDPDGNFLAEWRNVVTPWGVWISPQDDVWVCGSSPMLWPKDDPSNPRSELLGLPPKDQVFMKFDTTGRLTQLWTVPKARDGAEKPGECNWLHTMAFDSKGNLYAGDILGQRAQKFVPVR